MSRINVNAKPDSYYLYHSSTELYSPSDIITIISITYFWDFINTEMDIYSCERYFVRQNSAFYVTLSFRI